MCVHVCTVCVCAETLEIIHISAFNDYNESTNYTEKQLTCHSGHLNTTLPLSLVSDSIMGVIAESAVYRTRSHS